VREEGAGGVGVEQTSWVKTKVNSKRDARSRTGIGSRKAAEKIVSKWLKTKGGWAGRTYDNGPRICKREGVGRVPTRSAQLVNGEEGAQTLEERVVPTCL